MSNTYENDPIEIENDFLCQVENQWRESRPKLTDSYLLDVFGDGLKDIIDEKIKELERDQDRKIRQIKFFSQKYVKGDDLSSTFSRMCIEFYYVSELLPIEKSLAQLKRLRDHYDVKKAGQHTQLTLMDIDRARNFPIVDLIGQNSKKSGKNYLASCPFHNDSTPSLYIYTESNRFHCFGCCESGDSIKYVRKTLGLSFKDAIYYLISK